MPDLTLVLGPNWSRFSKLVRSPEDITAADQLPILLEFDDADITGISDLYEILNLLRPQRNTCVIRGQLKPNVEQPCRRLLKPRTEEGVYYDATIEDVPRRWLMVDFDSVPEPDGYSFVDAPAHCAEYLRSLLPAPFRAAECIWRASGSAGFKPGIRCHLWFLLDRPVSGDDCKAWLSHAAAPVDRTVYGAVQPHYTADPELEGVDDPMACRIGMLRGLRSVVPVPAEIPADLIARAKPTIVTVTDARSVDPFITHALRKWDADHPWDVEPDLSTRFECPACGSSDGCALLPDGKLFCHGAKHPQLAPNIGHAANNGYVMHRFEAFERCAWEDARTKLVELGYYPAPPAAKQTAVTEAVDAMSDVVEGRVAADVDLRALKKAKKELKETADLIRLDKAQAEALAHEFAVRHVPRHFTAIAVRDALIAGGDKDRLWDADVEEAIARGIESGSNKPKTAQPSVLAVDIYGNPERCQANVTKLISLSPICDALAWDVRARQVVVIQQPCWLQERPGFSFPRPFDDIDAIALVSHLADRCKYTHATTGAVREAVTIAADGLHFDPVLDYLEQLPAFEGTIDDARLVVGCWLTEYAGAPSDEYTRAVAMRWLVSGVARAYEPGCKVREVLTLTGPQNIGKSMLFAALCADPTWFKDDLNLKRHPAQALLGHFIVELAELDKLVATDAHGEMKAFISSNTDKYLAPYGHFHVSVPRRQILGATANPTQLFRDATGNTRYNVVELSGRIDVESVRAVRDELWSAARMLYKAGEQWWLTSEEQSWAVERQEAAREVFDAEEYLRDAVGSTFVGSGPLLSMLQGQIEELEEVGVDGKPTKRKRYMWVTTTQLASYLRELGVGRNVHKQIKQAMSALGWIAVRHVGDLKNGPRGYLPKASTWTPNVVDVDAKHT